MPEHNAVTNWASRQLLCQFLTPDDFFFENTFHIFLLRLRLGQKKFNYVCSFTGQTQLRDFLYFVLIET